MTEPFPILADFAGMEGQRFAVAAPGLAVPVLLNLTEARAWGVPWSPEGRQPFLLHFEGPPEPVLPQGTYRFQRPPIEVDMFTVPLGPAAGGFLYEVVFA